MTEQELTAIYRKKVDLLWELKTVHNPKSFNVDSETQHKNALNRQFEIEDELAELTKLTEDHYATNKS